MYMFLSLFSGYNVLFLFSAPLFSFFLFLLERFINRKRKLGFVVFLQRRSLKHLEGAICKGELIGNGGRCKLDIVSDRSIRDGLRDGRKKRRLRRRARRTTKAFKSIRS